MEWTAIVLTGGASRRLGRDKAAEPVAGVPMLTRVVAAIPEHVPLIIVGPVPVPLTRPHRTVREEPPGTGPVAAIDAAIALVDTPTVVVLATDQPFLGDTPARLHHFLAAADPATEAVLATDHSFVRQPLCAAYRTAALRRAMAHLPTTQHASMRAVLNLLRIETAPPAVARVDPTADVDTADDLRRAQSLATELEVRTMMDDWITAVTAELGIESEVDVDTVLDIAKDVAHLVQRPAAPVTTYLVGVAVGRGMSVGAASTAVRTLAAEWQEPS